MKKLNLKISLIIGKFLYIIGICSYAMAVILLISFLGVGFDYLDVLIIGLAFFIVVGFILCNVAKKIKVNADNIRQYVPIIINGNVRQLDNIAETTGKPYEVVKEDIQKMHTLMKVLVKLYCQLSKHQSPKILGIGMQYLLKNLIQELLSVLVVEQIIQ